MRNLSRRRFLGGVAAVVAAGMVRADDTAGPKVEHCKLAAEYNAAHKGISMLVMAGGEIIFEDYPNGGRADRAHELASGTKSFSGVMAVAAAEEGLLELDELVAKTIGEWKDDPRRGRMTIRQLLNLVGGLPGGKHGRPPTYAEAIATAANDDPGSRFQYGPVPFQVFGEVMRRKLEGRKIGVLEYLHQRILDPIGLKVGSWRKGTDGQPHLPSGAALTAREWVKFGRLLCQRGKWEGKAIVPADRLDECFKATKANPYYGLTWWMNASGATPAQAMRMRAFGATLAGRGVPADLVMAAGAGKQRLYVSRSLNLVVVRQATGILEALTRGEAGGFSDAEFLGRLLRGKAGT